MKLHMTWIFVLYLFIAPLQINAEFMKILKENKVHLFGYVILIGGFSYVIHHKNNEIKKNKTKKQIDNNHTKKQVNDAVGLHQSHLKEIADMTICVENEELCLKGNNVTVKLEHEEFLKINNNISQEGLMRFLYKTDLLIKY